MILPRIEQRAQEGLFADPNAWLDKLLQVRNAAGKNNIIVVLGEPRVGKSAVAVVLARRNDKTFTVDRILWDPEDYFKIYKTLPSPCYIIFDEGGVSHDTESWGRAVQRAARHSTQAFGFKLINIIIVATELRFIDITHRTMGQYVLVVQDRGQALVRRKWSDHIGHMYLLPVGRLRDYPMVDKEFWDEYSKRKEVAYDEMMVKETQKIERANKRDAKRLLKEGFDIKEPVIKNEGLERRELPA